MANIINNNLAGNVPAQNTLVFRLSLARADIASMADFNAAADDYLAFISTVAASRRSLAAIRASVTATQAAVDALPSSRTIGPVLDKLDGAARSINFTGIVSELIYLNATLAGMPSIPGLVAQLVKIADVVQVRPCVESMLNE